MILHAFEHYPRRRFAHEFPYSRRHSVGSEVDQYPCCVAQRKLRARDVDRDVAIDVVEAAWADGQLSREEYDRRVDRLLKASTVIDLEREILDLQPEGVNWQPSTSSVPSRSNTSPPLNEAGRKRHNRLIAMALMLAIVVVVALVARSAGDGHQANPPSQQVPRASEPAMLSSAGFIAARDELGDHVGSDSVYSAVLTNERFEVVRPTSAAGTAAVRSVFEDGQWGADESTSFDGERLSLELVNAEAVSTILDEAGRQVGEQPTLKLKFQISRFEAQRVCITATSVADPTWIAKYDCRGQEVTN